LCYLSMYFTCLPATCRSFYLYVRHPPLPDLCMYFSFSLTE
jgi:hypothetical protein